MYVYVCMCARCGVGPIPSELGTLAKLTDLRLEQNWLTGSCASVALTAERTSQQRMHTARRACHVCMCFVVQAASQRK